MQPALKPPRLYDNNCGIGIQADIRMKQKKLLLLLPIISIIFVITLFIIVNNFRSRNNLAAERIQPTNTSWLPNPENYPPGKATMWAAAQQTQLAANLLPTPNAQNIYPRLQEISANEILATKLLGTLAGNGIISEEDPPLILGTIDGKKENIYDLDNLIWYEETFDSFIKVWTGVSNIIPGKGVVYVVHMPHYNSYEGFQGIETTNPTGRLSIIRAVGERLILQSEYNGVIFFDVAGLTYINSFEEQTKTIEFIPTLTATPKNKSYDDAPNYPIEISNFVQTDLNLEYFINYPNDYDWFEFYTLVPGKITISLTRSPGSCALRAVKLGTKEIGDPGEIVGEETSQGMGAKQIILTYAMPSDYLIRVWCPDGSYSTSKSYVLRIDVPKPEKVKPILECVSENVDGSFTAHFGYDNPNEYVVNVNADNDNSFHPGPVFRTGQPEQFAPGRVVDFFSVLFDGNGLTWTLDGGAVTANRNSPRCP